MSYGTYCSQSYEYGVHKKSIVCNGKKRIGLKKELEVMKAYPVTSEYSFAVIVTTEP